MKIATFWFVFQCLFILFRSNALKVQGKGILKATKLMSDHDYFHKKMTILIDFQTSVLHYMVYFFHDISLAPLAVIQN